METCRRVPILKKHTQPHDFGHKRQKTFCRPLFFESVGGKKMFVVVVVCNVVVEFVGCRGFCPSTFCFYFDHCFCIIIPWLDCKPILLFVWIFKMSQKLNMVLESSREFWVSADVDENSVKQLLHPQNPCPPTNQTWLICKWYAKTTLTSIILNIECGIQVKPNQGSLTFWSALHCETASRVTCKTGHQNPMAHPLPTRT